MIKVNVKTKAMATLTLANHLRTYLFEQEVNELKYCTSSQKEVLKNALSILDKVVANERVK